MAFGSWTGLFFFKYFYSDLRAHMRADGASGTFFRVFDPGRVISHTVEFLIDRNRAFGTRGNAVLAAFAQLPVDDDLAPGFFFPVICHIPPLLIDYITGKSVTAINISI